VTHKDQRAITLEEHQKIIAAEVNLERKALYQLCWHLGASQGDIANLKGEDVDWQQGPFQIFDNTTAVVHRLHHGLRHFDHIFNRHTHCFWNHHWPQGGAFGFRQSFYYHHTGI
jgi:integrase